MKRTYKPNNFYPHTKAERALRAAVLASCTVGATLALGAAPPCWTDALGVEIGASVAHAETADGEYKVIDVSGWGNSWQYFKNDGEVKLVKGGTVLATFTAPKANDLEPSAWLSYSSEGPANGTITMANRRIDDVTIYENTKLKCALYTNPYSPVTLKGEGASISVFENEYKATLAAGSAEATLSFDDMHANCWDLTGTDGTKLSGEVGNYMLYGMVDISDVSKSTYTAHVGPNATVKTAQGTIHGASEYKWNNFLVDGDTTTIWNGTFGDIEKTGNGKLVVRNENEAWDLTAGNITADEVITAGNVTANSIMADEVSGKNVSVTDTLSVAKELNVDTVTASTVILASGASVSGQKGGTSNIKTNMLQVDPATAATALANATVAAKTEGGTVNITNLAGLKIPDATLAKIATAAKLSEGGYTSATTGDTKKSVTEMLDKADQLGKGTTTTKLQDGTDAVAYEHT